MLSSSRLAALAALCDAGSFEHAAARLHITPSALSQRISAFEREVGQVLVQRLRPVVPTAAGHILLGLAHQQALMHDDALRRITPESEAQRERLRISLAINADSISTWFRPALTSIAADGKILLTLHVEDQDHTAQMLAEGRVMAAVTTSETPAPGCRAEPLGEMAYWTACSPTLLAGRAPDEVELDLLPMLRFDLKDDLQHKMLRRLGITSEPPTHIVPSNREFLTAARLGLGWGVLPKAQIARDLKYGRLVRLFPQETVSVRLFWQRWRIQSTALDDLTDKVHQAARSHLAPPVRR